MPSLYIHIPFCAKKCAYCDFASYAGRQDVEAEYIKTVLREADSYRGERLSTVFIGGGTPSLLSLDAAQTLLCGICERFDIEDGAEWTIECNPDSVDREKLRLYREYGVNRISLGAQASQEHLLRILGRIHTWREAENTVKMAQAEGFTNVNLDLMYALPTQTIAQWRETLERAVALDIPHISAYSLIWEERTPLTRQMERGALSPCGEEEALFMQHMAEGFLKEAGLFRYEISNYAKKGFHSRHNMVYWTRGEYIGLGCAAHSLFRGARYRNADAIEEYMAGGIGREKTVLSLEDALEETVLLGTRTSEGINLRAIEEKFGTSLWERAKALESMGYALIEGDRMRLTQKGMDVHNAAVAQLLF